MAASFHILLGARLSWTKSFYFIFFSLAVNFVCWSLLKEILRCEHFEVGCTRTGVVEAAAFSSDFEEAWMLKSRNSSRLCKNYSKTQNAMGGLGFFFSHHDYIMIRVEKETSGSLPVNENIFDENKFSSHNSHFAAWISQFYMSKRFLVWCSKNSLFISLYSHVPTKNERARAPIVGGVWYTIRIRNRDHTKKRRRRQWTNGKQQICRTNNTIHSLIHFTWNHIQ